MDKTNIWIVRILVAFLSLHSLLVKVQCQCDAATRPMVLSASNTVQYFTSPDYPSNYPPNADCAWYIEAPNEYDKIILNVEEFRSQQDEFLKIYDGPNATGDPLEEVDDTNQKQFNAYVSPGHQLFFTFQSDGANEQKGFNILYFTNNSANQYPCGEDIQITSEEAIFMSPNLPEQFTADDDCDWSFTTTNDTILFKIKFMDMASCKPEYLSFYDGTSDADPLLAQECSEAYTYEFADIETTGPNAYLKWTVSEGAIGYGFMLTFRLSSNATNSTNGTEADGFVGINMTYPENNGTIVLTIPEDQKTGRVNKSIALIILTYTGALNLNIDPSYEVTTDQTVELSQVQLFAFDDTDPPYLYLLLTKSLDYEIIKQFSLNVTLSDSDVPEVTYSVTFNITITDVNDIAPTFVNLPYIDTLKRNRKAGYHLYTVNATDDDGTAENQVVTFEIFSGDTDAMFTIDATTGEIRLVKDSNQIPTNVEQYNLNIAAYSETDGSKLGNFETFTVYVDPDSPPECSNSTVWANLLDINIASVGTILTFPTAWSCSDDQHELTYSIETVSPVLGSPAFEIDNSTGVMTLLRTIAPTDVASRQFVLEIGATDSIGQMETFNIYLNVTAMSCLPNPRKLYVRMDQALNGAILRDFNCTITRGLTYTLKQYPQGTFAINEDSHLILTASVVKIKFYGLTVTITDGVDVAVLEFNIIVQTRRCGVASRMTPLSKQIQHYNIVLVMFVICVTKLSKVLN